MTTTDAVRYERDPRGVVTITLARPDRHNAFDDAMIAGLTEAFDTVVRDGEARLVVLAGEGRSFCAGADLAWMRRMADFSHDENLADARALAVMLERLDTLPVPTLGRIHGPAYGGGVGLVACCDIPVGTPAAGFVLSEVRLGLVPATIGPFVVNAIGARAARRYFVTAERFDADEAVRLGLLAEVVDPGALDRRLDELVEAILAAGPLATREAKVLVGDLARGATAGGMPIDPVAHTSELIARLRGSEEGREGVAAFLEKRPPRWKS